MSHKSAPKKSPGIHFETSDIEELRQVLSERVRPCRFLARRVPYRGIFSQHRAGSLGISAITIGPAMDVVVDPVEDSYLFQTPLAGQFRARCLETERSYGWGDVQVINPAAPIYISMDAEAAVLVVRVAKSTLEEHASVLTDTPVDGGRLLPEALPVTRGEAAGLRRYLGYLHAEIMDPHSPLHDTASRSAEQLLVSLMLTLADRDPARARIGRAAIGGVEDHARRAEEFIDGHLDEDIGLVDIVRSAGVDARTLQVAFRDRRGAGPLAWLERRRMEQASRELPAARPVTARELEIARLVAAGLNNGEIASCLAISRNTVKEAMKRIFRKVDVDSRAELVARLAEAGLL
jgi:DNA-binding CsgD family transcriptional regulator